MNGYTIGVNVHASNGQTHSYENTNKVQLEETRLEHITDEISFSKQIILLKAYNNPEASYTKIHELIRDERIDYSNSVVRRTIKKYVEKAPSWSDSNDAQRSGPSESTEESVEPDWVDFDKVDPTPLSASPYDDPVSEPVQNEGSATGETTSESAAPKQSSRITDGSNQVTPDDHSLQNSTEAGPNFPYDVEAVPDCWSPTATKIIAAYEALGDKTRAEVHEILTQEHGMEISKSLVYKVLYGWEKQNLDDLTAKEQRAIKAIVNKDDNETLADIANRLDCNKGWLTFLKYIYPHILVAEGGHVSEMRNELNLSNAPFDIDTTLDADSWTKTQRTIISAHEAIDHSTDRELQNKLTAIGIHISRSTIRQTLSEYIGIDRRSNRLKAKEKTYEDLNDRQQDAVDILANAPPAANITKLSDTVPETRGYLYDINDRFHHVIENQREENPDTDTSSHEKQHITS
ncbi:hypothetical protein AArcSl_2234 [Halalkaliarchaeum desulfuricum]|uniref:Uncharacterized protein n=1 Tax=Halalkaliarchaeum desulfuricum TaxID=2055893 RepID=A0A343TL86_9EURY|nr:hypothetical protein AArcSl_2234 [Halalkaliarchaeum desulfuricum]